MKKPFVIAIIIGIFISSTSIAQYNGWLGAPQGPSMASMYPGMYNQAGMFPVAGAQNYIDPFMAQQLGSGQMMLNQCAYNQNQIVDPIETEPEVEDAREKLDGIKDQSDTAKDAWDEAKYRFDTAKSKLSSAVNMPVLNLMGLAKKCDDLTGTLSTKASSAVAAATANSPAGECNSVTNTLDRSKCVNKACLTTLRDKSSGLSGEQEVAACGLGTANICEANPSGGSFDLQALCTDVPSPTNSLVKFTPFVKPGKHDDCVKSIGDAYKAYMDMKKAQEDYNAAKEKRSEASHELAHARKDAQRRLEREAKEDAADGYSAAGAGIRYCQGCSNGTAVQKPSPSKFALGLAAGLIGGISYYSIRTAGNIAKDDARAGYVVPPYLASSGAIISHGISNGFNAGAPFLNQGLYGQYPAGYAQGGFGCAPTINGSQMNYPNGPFINGANNGSYFPGGAYMPGMGPWGVNGYPGMMPGYPGMYPGMYPGGGAGGYNPMMMQQMAMMQQQYMDQMRAQQIAMYSIGYGLNAANQQYSYAQQMLAGSQYGMNSGVMGPGMMMPQGYLGGQNYGLSNYLNGTFTGGFAQQGCGNPFSSISICGALPLGGSSYPTYTNGFSPGITGVSSPYGVSPFGASSYGASPYGVSGGGSFNWGAGYHR